ncbi:MAG: hypothetical protein EOO81_05485 [Oxalobacteraceae bacterium]|nr:MAG: hypothetical protein EOO81_05485 [Oxalobacteraceae bacterium]
MADDIGRDFETQQHEPLVHNPHMPALSIESSGLRAIALFNQAKAAGEEHVTNFLHTIELAVKQAREIVDGKEVYPAGVRDICEKMVEYSASRAQAIFSIMRPDGPHRSAAPFEASVSDPPLRSLEESDLAIEIKELKDTRDFGHRS